MPEDRKKHLAEAGAGAGALYGTSKLGDLEHKFVEHKKAQYDKKIRELESTTVKGTPVVARKKINGQYMGSSAGQKEAKRGRLKRVHGELNELHRQKNLIKRPKLAGNAKATWAGIAVGAPLLWHGARESVEKRDLKRSDVDAGVLGAALGAGGYQEASYALKPLDRLAEKKIAADPVLRRRQKDYQDKMRPKNAKAGDKAWRPYFRNYPKDLPGGRLKRATAVTHTGKSGAALTVAAAGAGAVGAVKVKRHFEDKKVSKVMHKDDPFEISKVSAKLKIVAGAKRGLFDAAGVTHPKLREKAYAGNGPVKSKLYNIARTKTRTEMEPRLVALREDPAVKRAAFRIVREEAGKKLQRAKPYVKGAAVGAAGTSGAVVVHHHREKVQKNLSQEQIDRRKKIQAASSKTTATLGLAALGAQGAGELVSRGKIKKLPSLKDGSLVMREVTKPKKEAAKLKTKVTPLLATSAGVGAISGFNFASYTKAEAKQHKNYS